MSSYVIFSLSELFAQLLSMSPADEHRKKVDDERQEYGGYSPSRDKPEVAAAAGARSRPLVQWRKVFGFGCLALYNAPAMHFFFSATAALPLTAVGVRSVPACQRAQRAQLAPHLPLRSPSAADCVADCVPACIAACVAARVCGLVRDRTRASRPSVSHLRSQLSARPCPHYHAAHRRPVLHH